MRPGRSSLAAVLLGALVMLGIFASGGGDGTTRGSSSKRSQAGPAPAERAATPPAAPRADIALPSSPGAGAVSDADERRAVEAYGKLPVSPVPNGDWSATAAAAPAAPMLTDTDPDSPANNNSPRVKGTAVNSSTVRLYKAPTNADCTPANLVATGTNSEFASPGLLASVPDDSSTRFRATATKGGQTSACSGSSILYVEDSTPPSAPTLTDTDPDSPANDNAPSVKGTAAAGSTVRLYKAPTSSDCIAANLSATGSAAQFASPGLSASVVDDSSTTFRAIATDAAGNASGCSSSSIVYVEDSTPPGAPTVTDTDPDSPANDNTPSVKGTAAGGSTVRVYKAATTSGCTAANLAATGSAVQFASPGLSASVADDSTTTFRATATDAAGNASACSSSEIVYVEDSTLPAPPTLTDTDPDSPANDNSPRVKGTAAAGSTVRLFTTSDCSGPVAATGTAAQFASPGLQVLAADDTTTTFRATATDAAGNASACSSSSIVYVEDSTPPAAPSLTDTDPDSPANDNSPNVKGTAAGGSTVRLFKTSDCSGSVVATGTAAQFASPGLSVSVADDSSTTFRATATDAAGNTSTCSSSSVVYVEDSTPPAAATLTDTDPDSPANDNSPRVKGTAAAGSTVRLFTTSDCSGTVAATGTAAEFASPGLQVLAADDTSTTFRATATDAAGNTSGCSSSSIVYVEDSTPPAAPTLTDTDPDSPANANSPTVKGTAAAGSTVRLFTTSDCSGSVAATGTAAEFASPGLQVLAADDTTTTFHATATDAAGNTSACSSSSIVYVEDSTPPAAPTLTDTDPDSPANDNSPTIKGTAAAGSTVRLFTTSDCSGTVAATGTATQFASPGLQVLAADDTTTSFHATATDAAGNTSACSTSSIVYVEDSTPPAAPSLTDTDPDSPANDNSPSVKGTAAAGSTIRLFTTSDCSGTVAATGSAAQFASPGLSVSVADDSSTTFRATAADAAGNTSTCSSSSVVYVEDSTPPAAPTLTDTDPDSPANDNSPSVKGAVAAGSTVRIYKANTIADCTPANLVATGTASQFASPGFSISVADDSSTTFRATAADTAGNTSACSTSSVVYVEDSTPPAAPTLTDTDPDSPANDNSPRVKGTAADGSTVRLFTSGDCSGAATATGTAAQFASPGLSVSVTNDSSTTFRATATDAAGNTSGCSTSSIVYVEDSTPPAAPNLTDTDPDSPANDNSPRVKGTAAGGSTVRLYKAPTTAGCTAANLVATGTAAQFASPGFQVSVTDDSSTTFRATATDAAGNASGCSASSIVYVEDSTPPAAPSLTDTDPDSPANDNSPNVKGTAAGGSTVRLFTSGDCSGTALTIGTAAEFASPGLQVSVTNNSSTTFRATATDAAGNTSACSTSSIVYVEDSTPLAAPQLTDTDPDSPSNDNSPRVKGTAAAEPWFLYVAPTAPHSPFTVESQYLTAPVPPFVPNPAYFESDRSDKPPYIQQTTEDPAVVQTHRTRQLRMLKSVDDLVSQVFSTLDSVGQTNDTLAFFVSDNGYQWGEHGLKAKPYPYTHNAKIPLYMRWPGKLAGGTDDPRIVANIDLAPTVMDAAGLSPDPAVDGASLLGTGSRDRILIEFLAYGQLGFFGFPTWASIRTTSYQYTEYYGDAEVTPDDEPVFREYYDLAADPWQLTNYLGDANTANDPPAAILDALHTQLRTDLTCAGRDGVDGKPACGPPSSGGGGGSNGRPNVLMVVTDDQRIETLHVMPRTRELFDEQGIDFTNGFATTPLCCPSRASILSGRYAHNHGVRNNTEGPLLDQGTTIARRLQNAGYRTGIYGKFLNDWNLSQNPPHFDRWSIFNNGPYTDFAANEQGQQKTIAQYATSYVADKASQFITQQEYEPGATVRLYKAATIGDCTPANLVATGTPAAFASPGFQVSVAGNSSSRFRATVTDAAGNASGCSSDSIVYVEDSTPPAVPQLTDTDPDSPANDNSPRAKGTAAAGSTVRLYKAPTTGDCTPANLVATGTAAGFASPGLTVSVSDNSTTRLRATGTDAAGNTSACSTTSIVYVEDSTPPSVPQLTDTDPDSPANDNSPRAKGTAGAGSTVRLYKAATTADCTPANLVATGTTAEFASPGLLVSVPDNSTTRLRATGTDAAGNASACSSTSIVYVEDSAPPAAPQLTDTDPDSPANDTAPLVKGTAATGSTVRLYKAATTADCTPANLAATGSAAQLASPGLQVSVPNNSTTRFRAIATDAAGNSSGCSSSSIVYVESL